MGSTPHAHARAAAKNPHEQGLTAMISVFIDTFIVLNLTVFSVLTTGALDSGKDGIALTQEAFMRGFGSFGDIFVAICLFFFAFSTVLGWNLFGRINANYLFGRKNKKLCNTIYTIIALVFIFLGTLTGNDFVWELTDMFNNLIVLPNALALFALTGMVVAMLKEGQQSKLKV